MEELQINPQNSTIQNPNQMVSPKTLGINKKIIISELKWLSLYLLTFPLGFICSVVLFYWFMKYMSGESGIKNDGAIYVGVPLFFASLPIFILIGIAAISRLRNKKITRRIKALVALTIPIDIILFALFLLMIFT